MVNKHLCLILNLHKLVVFNHLKFVQVENIAIYTCVILVINRAAIFIGKPKLNEHSIMCSEMSINVMNSYIPLSDVLTVTMEQ